MELANLLIESFGTHYSVIAHLSIIGVNSTHQKRAYLQKGKKSKNYQAYRVVYLELISITINISEKFITNIRGLAVIQHPIDLGNIHILVLVRMPCSLKCLNCLVWI